MDIAIDENENLFIADDLSHRVWKRSTNGNITAVAGNGTPLFTGDGVLATQTGLFAPSGVAVDGKGNLYISDARSYRIFKVGPDGIITIFAGNGTNDFSGDGGPATQAGLSFPTKVAVDGSGELFIVDSSSGRIRKVGSNGIITTIAGNGNVFSGDEGPATQAGIGYPTGIAIDGSGSFYIATPFDNRIRKVGSDGIIKTIAGNGTQGFSGDGGPATQAELHWPGHIAVGITGSSLFISDVSNNRIRAVSYPYGSITTVAGNGTAGYAGDGGLATQAELNTPGGIVIDRTGNLYFVDFENSRIREVIASTCSASGGGAGAGSGYNLPPSPPRTKPVLIQ
jgi:sugar lactone lactonase YvrE